MDTLFIEFEAFAGAARKRGLPNAWLEDLKSDILLGRGRITRPRGLGGFEKIRAPNPLRGKGKSGGFRVYFIRYKDLGAIVFALLSDKDVETNISREDQKELRALARTLRQEVKKHVETEERKRPGTRGEGRD